MDRRLFIISLILFVNVTGNGLILPLLPFFADHLGASPIIIGIFISTYPFFAILAGPILGELSDKYGRKPILLFSIAGTVIGFLLLGIAQTLPLLFLARIIDGASAGNSSTARAVIADITPKEKRVSKLGITFAAESLGLIAGPLVGGFFAQYGFTVSALVATGFAVLALLLTLVFLPETKNFAEQPVAKKKSGVDLSQVFTALQNPRVRTFVLATFLIQFLITVMWGTLALYGNHFFGLTGKDMGYISAFAATIGILSQTILLNVLLKFLQEKYILIVGLTAMCIGMLALGISTAIPILLLGVGLMAMSFNIAMPTVTGIASKLSSEEDQGRLMGTISSTTYLGSLSGPVVGNALYTLSMRGNYLFGSMVALLAAVFSGLWIRYKLPK